MREVELYRKVPFKPESYASNYDTVINIRNQREAQKKE